MRVKIFPHSVGINFYIQGYADDAWKQMLRTTGGDRSPYSVILARTRRDYQVPPTGIENPAEAGLDAAKSASGEGGGGNGVCSTFYSIILIIFQ